MNIELIDSEDPCLVHPIWLELNISQPLPLIELNKILNQTLNQAKSQQIPKIEINLSTDLQPVLDEVLLNNKYLHGLVKLQHTNAQNNDSPQTNFSNISSDIPNFSQYQHLLIQQAEYHYLNWPNYYNSPNKINWNTYKSTLLEPNSTVLTYSSQNMIIGLLTADTHNNQTKITELIVNELHRNQGIGQQLLQEFFNLSNKKHIQNIFVETFFNQKSISLYQRNNFKPISYSYYQNLN